MRVEPPDLESAPGKATYPAMSESTREDHRYIMAGLRVHTRASLDENPALDSFTLSARFHRCR
jgi:hypothetical protein